MELDYYPLKSAAAKIGCSEEDLISLAAEDKLAFYFKLGGRAVLEMDRGCPDDWQEIAFYSLPPLKIYASTIERYQSDPSVLLFDLINPDDPDSPGYCLKEPVPLKDITLFVSSDDVARLSQLGDYRGSKSEEPDYYPLNLAAEITGYTKDYLICLAADNKLPLYVKLGGKEAWEFESHFQDGDSPDFCYLPKICKVWASTIEKYQSDPSVLLLGLSPLDDPAINCYNLKDKIPLKDITLFVSAEDVARLSKNEKGKSASVEILKDIQRYKTPFVYDEGKGLSEPTNVKDGEDSPIDNDEGRRNNQIDFICSTARSLQYDLLAIPEGGKTAIKAECLKKSLLFTDAGFGHAWKEANQRNVIRVKDKEKYLKNQE
jgi:hypothetical protein